ncbi:ABC transporter ATP-binding protein [Xylophilus sp.]|uniref:ABC transporter ATP-binding protein n=1 Tax=Xylophilus sp. TaxID=2653893 RepID=UPI0013BDDAC6|nr:ABC transporter ATP-binding protein [Xylophilus sp.]KAF1046015.1 MAG: Bicarbonate transport ATP-binding protein CmpD [Xylophilus sp.]
MASITLDRVGFDFTPPGKPRTGPGVLEDVSLQIADGEFAVLLGPSGCGKSTILNLVAGFERPRTGRVLAGGQPVAGPDPSRGVVFQQPLLYPWLTVLENVTFGPRMNGRPQADYLRQARELLQLVGLARQEDAYPWQLSGGMRQRVALARAWIMRPAVLLMDEPFGALDAQTRALMQELLLDIWSRDRTTVLFVTHDVDEALLLGTRVLAMSARPGRIVEDLRLPFGYPRDAEALLEDPAYGPLKRQVLHRVREEARRHLAA